MKLNTNLNIEGSRLFFQILVIVIKEQLLRARRKKYIFLFLTIDIIRFFAGIVDVTL